MNVRSYRKPPITEAIIQLRFAEPTPGALVTKASRVLKKSYHDRRAYKNFSVKVTLTSDEVPEAKADAPYQFYRLVSEDNSEILVVSETEFTLSQLPDYPGWSTIEQRFQRDWRVWREITGFRKVSRIGVRYINRLDIPFDGRIIEEDQYLTFNIRSPDVLGVKHGYSAQARFFIAEIDGLATINSGVVPSPLSGYASVLLDIDIERSRDLPARDEDLLALLRQIRLEKNRVFELCITEKARQLFDHE